MIKSALQICGLSALSLTLFACEFGNGKSSNLAVSELEPLPVTEGKLVKATSDTLATTLHNGLFLNNVSGFNHGRCVNCFLMQEDAVAAEAADADGAAEPASGNFSNTTTQEQGVAESDRVKYNGNTLFVASNTEYWHWGAEQEFIPPHVRVLHKNTDNSLSELATIEADEEAYNLSELYLHQDHLAMLYDVFEVVQKDSDETTEDIAVDAWFYPHRQSLGINFQNISEPSTPEKIAKYTLDGHLVSSRRIEDKIHLVTRYTPSFPEQIDIASAHTEIEIQSVYDQLIDTNLSDLLPKIYDEDGTEQQLVTAENCFVPEQLQANYGYAQITTITTFDIDSPEAYSSKCIVAPMQNFYSSADNMYLYEQKYLDQEQVYKTVIHKFSYQTQAIEYEASGSVQGHTGWGNSHLRFSEYNDHLRVVTSESRWQETGNQFTHRLFVLAQTDNNELSISAELPNANQPAAIGKPGEDIYAVRYFGDKAYVVTFRRIDPLYVINLEDETAPYIQGELEIPGYSGYLQPLNDKFVLGIGQQVDPNTGEGLIPVTDDQAAQSEFIEGAKAELYDVSDPTNPKVAATIVYENNYSVVEYDYHALTQLQTSESTYRFAFPTGGWTVTENQDGSRDWNYTQAMQLLEVNTDGEGSMISAGALKADSDYYGQWGDRAVLHDDVVFYIRNNSVWQSLWSSPDVLHGPF